MAKKILDLLKDTITASLGLVLFGFGVYLTIQANIGAAPWDVFCLGVSGTLGIKYGTASIIISVVIVVFDILLKEKIGIGMLLDAVLVGKSVDLFNLLDWVPKQEKPVFSVLVITAGMFIMAFSQFVYMKAALGCGPRDSLLVGLKRRTKKIPIGVVSICMLAVVTGAGYLLGGPVGTGTLMCAFLIGPIMQLIFKITRFDPTGVVHQSIKDSIMTLIYK